MTLLPLNETDICHSASSGDARPRGIFRVGLSPREMCEVWGRVCARSDSDRHSTRLRSKDATASQHTRTPTPCCCGTSRNPPVQALLCLDAPSDVEAAPFPSEHRKVHALGLPRERAHHCDNTLSSSCNQRWFNAFNTFASTRLQPICQLSPSCDWQSELGLRVIRLAVLLHKSGSPSAGVEPGLLLVQGHRATQLYTRRVELGHLL